MFGDNIIKNACILTLTEININLKLDKFRWCLKFDMHYTFRHLEIFQSRFLQIILWLTYWLLDNNFLLSWSWTTESKMHKSQRWLYHITQWYWNNSLFQYWAYIHWASKETYHFFRATHIKIQSIRMNHNWAYISYNTPYQAHLKILRLRESKKNKIRWNRKRSFFKNHRNCLLPGHGARYGQ